MSRPETARTLRGWLAKRLKISKVPDALWISLEKDRFVAVALEDEKGLQEFLRRARRLKGQQIRRRPKKIPMGTIRDMLKKLVPKDEALRARAFSSFVGRLAENHWYVRRFRSSYLGGKTLSVAKANGYLTKHGVTDDLREASFRVAQDCHWHQDQAIAFILTGKTPLIAAVAVGHREHWGTDRHQFTIDLSIQPWTSHRTVLRIYRHFQRLYFGDLRRGLADSKAVALFDFVSRVRQQRYTWRRAMDAWNQRNPDSEYDDVRHFARDYRRAERTMAFCGLPPVEGDPDLKAR